MTADKSATAAGARFDLNRSVTINGVQVSHLDLRRPKMRNVLRGAMARGSKVKMGVRQLSAVTGVAPKVIAALEIVDFLALQKHVQALVEHSAWLPALPTPRAWTRGIGRN